MRDLAIDAARPRAPKQDYMSSTTIKRVRKSGLPPPVTFDLDLLPDSAWLTTEEVAAIVRKSRITVAMWRRDPDHALKWARVHGLPRYRVEWVRNFINRDT